VPLTELTIQMRSKHGSLEEIRMTLDNKRKRVVRRYQPSHKQVQNHWFTPYSSKQFCSWPIFAISRSKQEPEISEMIEMLCPANQNTDPKLNGRPA